MYKRVSAFLDEHNMLKGKTSVILGLSGGADSVCLLLMLKKYILDKQYNIKLTAVHINHGIRGEEAQRDAEFCKTLCQKMDVEYRQFDYDVPRYSKEHKLSCEEAGRKLRYQAFKEVEQEYKAVGEQTIIAVAHHKNDQAETVLHNIVRGAALKGAMAIRPVRDGIIRPLLCLVRMEIEAYLAEESQEYCTDSTNLEDEYVRNKLRNRVIGYLESEVNAGTVANLCRFADKMALMDDYMSSQINSAGNRYVKDDEYCTFISEELIKEHQVIQSGVIYNALEKMCGYKDLEEKHVSYLMNLFGSQSGRQINLPRGIIAKRTYEGVFLTGSVETSRELDEILLNSILEGQNITMQVEWNGIGFEIGVKSVEEVYKQLGISDNFNKKFPNDLYTKFFDYDKILKYVAQMENISFKLRGRQTGDYMTIDNKGHTKKIKQYFIDEKIPEEKRDGIPLFTLGNNVIWAAGRRGSSDFLLDEKSRHALVLHMIN